MKHPILVFLALAMTFCITIVGDIRVLALCNITAVVFLSYALVQIQKQIFTPFNIIFLSLCIFHSGHLWLSAFYTNPITFFLDTVYFTHITDLLNVFKFVSILQIEFALIGILKLKPTSPLPQFSSRVELTNMGWIVFIIMFAISFLIEIRRAIAVGIVGYADGYHYQTNFASYMSQTITMLFIILIYSYRFNKKVSIWLFALMIVRSMFVIIFVGNRGTSVINLLLIAFMMSRYCKEIFNERFQRTALITMCVVFLVILPFVSQNRGLGNGLELQSYVQGRTFIEDFLYEFGGSIETVFYSEDYIKQCGCDNIQILATTLTIFPGSTALFGDVIAREVSIGERLNQFLSIRGLGGSMIAQIVFNYGHSVLAFLFMAFLAWLSCKMSNYLMSSENNSIYKIIIYLNLFSGLLFNVRGEWYTTVGQVKVALYFALFIYICCRTRNSIMNIITDER